MKFYRPYLIEDVGSEDGEGVSLDCWEETRPAFLLLDLESFGLDIPVLVANDECIINIIFREVDGMKHAISFNPNVA